MKERAPQFKKASPPGSFQKNIRAVFAIATVLAICGAAAYFLLRSDGLVTLDVKDKDVNEVLKIVARQTNQTILVTPGATGKVTLKVRKKPLNEVLDIIQIQTMASWREYYAVSNLKSDIEVFKNVLREGGETTGWNVRGPGGFGGGFGGPDAEMSEMPQTQLVEFEATSKPAKDVALALAYRTRARVAVPNSFAAAEITLNIPKKSKDEAIAIFAESLKSQYDHFYVVQSPRNRGNDGNSPRSAMNESGSGSGGSLQRGGGNLGRMGGPFGGMRPQNNPNAGARNSDGTLSASGTASAPPRERTPEEIEKRRVEREAERQAQLEAMTPEQREQAEKRRAQFEEFNKATSNMTPMQRMQEVQKRVETDPEAQRRQEQGTKRMMQALKNTTPEGRVEAYRRIAEGVKMFQQFQQQGFPQRPPSTAP